MASGDLIPGQVRVMREDTEGNQVRVLGPVSAGRVDYATSTVDAEEKLYVNTALSSRVTKPSGAESITARDAIWFAGEKLKVQHQANATVSNDIDYDNASAFAISILVNDRNRGAIYPRTLGAADTELTSNVAESADTFKTYFEVTVPDRQKWNLAGSFGAAALEA